MNFDSKLLAVFCNLLSIHVTAKRCYKFHSKSYICEKSRAPVFADPVSGKKAEKLLNVLDKLYAVTPNKHEAEVLSGVTIACDADLENESASFISPFSSAIYKYVEVFSLAILMLS